MPVIIEDVYEELAREWTTLSSAPALYCENLFQATLSKYRERTDFAHVESVLTENKSRTALFCGHRGLVVEALQPAPVLRIDRFDDLLVGFMTGLVDEETSFELSIGGVLWGETTLQPGIPGFPIRGTHVLPMIPIGFQGVCISFKKSKVPEQLYYIGGTLLHEERCWVQNRPHKFLFSNGDIGAIQDHSAFVHAEQKVPEGAFEVPDMTLLLKS